MPEFRLNFWRIALQGKTNGSVSDTITSYTLIVDLLPLRTRKLTKVLISNIKIRISENHAMALSRTNFIL